jgi:capsular polysaccharide transport system permease protein
MSTARQYSSSITPQADAPTPGAIKRQQERRRNMRIAAWCILGPTVASAIYFGVLAPPNYASSAEITIRGPQSPATVNILSGLGLGGVAGTSSDPRLVVDYLQAPVTIDLLRRRYGFREAYSRFSLDPFSRLDPHAPMEMAVFFWKGKLKVDYDSVANTITMSVKAYTPADSYRLAQGVLAAATAMEEGLNREVQKNSLILANQQVAATKAAYEKVQARVAKLQGNTDVLTMSTASQEAQALVAAVDPQIAMLKVQQAQTQAAYKPNSPQAIAIAHQIATLQAERDHAVALAKVAPGPNSAQHDILLQAALQDLQFAQKTYYGALAAQLAAEPQNMNQSFVVSFVPPRMPDESDYWFRLLDIIAVFLGSSVVFGVGALGYSVIKDHMQ